MGLFSRKSRVASADERLRHQAELLVSSAHSLAVAGYAQAAAEVPIINRIRANDWDFCLTVAGVFIAASALTQSGVSQTAAEQLMEIVARHLDQWNAGAVDGFDDCKALFERTYDRLAASPAYKDDHRFLASDAVGYWIAWNLLGHAPSQNDELELMRLAGVSVTHAFADWWRV